MRRLRRPPGIPMSAILEAQRREALVVRIERLTELPLLILAFVTIPLLVGPFLWELSNDQIATFAALSTFIWAVFATVLIAKFVIVPQKLIFLRRNWLEVLIVVAPFLRPLRLLTIVLYGS
ncbi:MAG: hypothetical protein ACE5Q6_17365, partial [Dehalococcoidia bacterium]